MTSPSPFVSHATTILDHMSARPETAASWKRVQALSVVFVAAMTAAASQVSFPIPFTPVPFTLQPMVVLVGAATLGARLGAASQILYLLAGILGLPVFAYAPELPQGLLRLVGPTGGYLMAYPAAAFVTGWLAERGFDRRYSTSILAMAAGLSAIFVGGVAWIAKDAGLGTALTLGLYPFLVVDLVKIVLAGLVLPSLWRIIKPQF
jgi:biotin transport system substrate-specific component